MSICGPMMWCPILFRFRCTVICLFPVYGVPIYLESVCVSAGERPHPCPDCGKPFRVRSDMKRHRQTHMRDGTVSTSGVAQAPSTHVTQAATPQSPSPTVTAQVLIRGDTSAPDSSVLHILYLFVAVLLWFCHFFLFFSVVIIVLVFFFVS